MTAKEYLQQIKKLDYKINSLNTELENLNHKKFELGSPGFKEVVCDNRDNKARFEKVIVRCDEVIGNLLIAQLQAIDLRHDIYQEILLLDNTSFNILHKRYFEYMPFKQIASDLSYNENHVIKLHGKALELLAEEIGIN